MSHCRCLGIAIALCTILDVAGADQADFAIRDGDTVAFLGDSITAARTYGKHIENFTLLRYPERKVRFLNLGIGGDTAAGGFKRLQRDVFDNNVTLLIVAFGVNDIGWGFKADDEHRQQYLDAIRGIVTTCQENGVRVSICSAAVTGGHPDTTENDFLQQMCDDGLAIADELGAGTIDVQRTMRDILRRILKANEGQPEDKHETLHTADGVHLNELGQLAMAYAILKGLGASEDVSSCVIDAESSSVVESTGCDVSDIVRDGHSMSFTRLDAGLPFNNGLLSTLAYRFVPMNELSRYRLTVTTLEPGEYTLDVSNRKIGTWSARQLAGGIDISSATVDPWQPGGPWDAQATSLKSLTDARHEVDLSDHFANAYLPGSPLNAELNTQTQQADQKLVQMQRLVAQPRPYKFMLTHIPAQTLITSPREYQVFQRQSRTRGPITISGTTTQSVDQVQVRFRGKPLEGEVPEQWQSIDIDSTTGAFTQTIAFPAGGWFAMDLRVLEDDKTLEQLTVDKFGVGEVFVGAGQSNSTNSGQFKTKQHSGMVASFGGENWQIADDPQIGVADNSQGGSYYPAFGDALYEQYKVPIGIASTGFGGTSVNAWQPPDGLFAHMLKRIDQLGPHGFRAILWHQGESDVGMASDEYYEKLKRVIVASREEAGWDIPWFVAQVSYHNSDKPSYDTTRSAQKRLWADGLAHEGPDTDTLMGDHRDLEGQGIHFSPKGLKAHGQMWVDKVRPLIDRSIETPKTGVKQ